MAGRHRYHTVGIDLKRYFYLGDAARRWRNPDQFEFSQAAISRGYFTFALKYVDLDDLLVIGNRSEHQALLNRNRRVPVEYLCKQASACFDAERQGNYVEKYQVLDITRQNAGLYRGTDRYDLIGIDFYRGFSLKYLSDPVDDYGRAGLASYQQHFRNIRSCELSVCQRFPARLNGSFNQVLNELFELWTGKRLVEVLGSGRIGRDEWKVQLRFGRGGQLAFCTFCCLLQPLEGKPVSPQVDASFFLEGLNHPVHYALIKVFTAEERIAAGRQHFKHPVAHFHNRDVEGAAAEVVY